MYVSPRIVGDDIFLLGIGHDLTKDLRPRSGTQEEVQIGFAQLLKFPKTGGLMKPLAKLAITGVWNEIAPENRGSMFSHPPATVALDDHNLYAAMDGEPCIGVFPLDGSPARKIPVERRTNQLVMLDGRLFAAWEEIWRTSCTLLASIDPATGNSTAIITATEGKPPEWSTQKAYYPRIIGLWSDAPRHRILYLAHGPRPDPAADGIWEYKPATAQKRLVLPLFIAERVTDPFGPSAIFWTGTNADGRILLFSRRGLVAFDPATDAARVILRQHPDLDPLATAATDPKAPRAPVSTNDMLAGRLIVERPCAIANGYLWFTNGRASLDGKQVEKFPPLRSGPQSHPADDGLTFLNNGNQLLVSDFYGAWILDIRP